MARLRPPDWRAHPTAYSIGELYGDSAAPGLKLALADRGADRVGLRGGRVRRGVRARAGCAGAGHDSGDWGPVIWDGPGAGAAVAQSMAEGLLSAGVQPVGKHAPGHGLAVVDSHHALPVIRPEADLSAEMSVFARCAGLPWMMTAHVVYQGIDPDWPATLSPTVIGEVIRAQIGFDGVLVSDDLAMAR